LLSRQVNESSVLTLLFRWSQKGPGAAVQGRTTMACISLQVLYLYSCNLDNLDTVSPCFVRYYKCANLTSGEFLVSASLINGDYCLMSSYTMDREMGE
jgi:hypothetical protein